MAILTSPRICLPGSIILTTLHHVLWILFPFSLNRLPIKLVMNPSTLMTHSTLVMPHLLPQHRHHLINNQTISLLCTSLLLSHPQVILTLFTLLNLRLPQLFPIPHLNPFLLHSLHLNKYLNTSLPNPPLPPVHHLRGSCITPFLPTSPLSLKPPNLRVSRLIFSPLSYSC